MVLCPPRYGWTYVIYGISAKVIIIKSAENNVYCYTEVKQNLNLLFRYNTNGDQPKLYKRTTKVLLAVKYVSYLNPLYFFQHSIMNCRYRNIESLFHPCHDKLNEFLQPFAMAITCNSNYWNNEESIRETMRLECNKFYFIETFINYVNSMKHTLYLAQKQVNSIFITITST